MEHLPEPLQTILTNATTTYLRSTAHTHLTTHLATLRTTLIDPYILTPLSHFLAAMLNTSSFSTFSSSTGVPDLMTALMLAGVLFASLIVLDYLRRFVIWWVMWWVRLIVRVVFWGSVVLVGVYVWNVGIEKAMVDAGRLGGFVMGFLEEGKGIVEGGSGGSSRRGKGSEWW